MRPFLVLVLFASLVFASTATQTDWSGGDLVLGPVTNWGNDYYFAEQINDSGGSLRLAVLEHIVDGSFEGALAVHAADIDGDGDTDVLGAAYWDDEIAWWENIDGTGTSWLEHTVNSDFNGANSVFATDIDGDGDTDVLGSASFDDEIAWWENTNGTGTSWTEHIVDDSFDNVQLAYPADVDGDGDIDVLGAAFYPDEITWWENTDGTGTSWTEHIVDSNFDGARSAFAADVDGDGDIDVLGAAFYPDKITWWENTDGTGIFWTEHSVSSNFDGARAVFAADLDGDGDIDVVGGSDYVDDITWWENIDGSGTAWEEHSVTGSFSGVTSVFVADIDGDGDMDVLGTEIGPDNVAWWENADGAGTEWIEYSVDCSFYAARSVFAADVDGDGNMDVLGAAHEADDITWWDVTTYSTLGTLRSSILNAGDVGEWNIFLSNSQEPAGTSVGFQFRSSEDSSSMGAWSDTLFSPEISLAGILDDSTRYLQYRAILETPDPQVSPELTEVAFSYTLQVDIGESESGVVPSWSLSITENPSYSLFSALVSVPEAGLVNLSLYDVYGRVIANVSQELPAGIHSVNFAGIAEGVYFCVMNAENFTSTEKIVLLK